MKKQVKAVILSVLGILMVSAIVAGLLFYGGIWHFNNPSTTEYPVRGVDVSSYQGNIDWDVLSEQDISFAYIKATEGSSFVDDFFEKNWQEAQETSLYIGAYHFFSFESAGQQQAEHYIETVGDLWESSLPPVIDVEYYDVPSDTDISAAAIRRELGVMIEVLTDYYNKKPVIYVTEKTYTDIIKDYFTECPLWIRSVYGKPNFVRDDEWCFWQYSNRYRLPGYDGKENYIDMNAYNGDLVEFTNQFSL